MVGTKTHQTQVDIGHVAMCVCVVGGGGVRGSGRR